MTSPFRAVRNSFVGLLTLTLALGCTSLTFADRATAAVALTGFGTWLFDSDGVSYRIQRKADGTFRLEMDQLFQARMTEANLTHLGPIPGRQSVRLRIAALSGTIQIWEAEALDSSSSQHKETFKIPSTLDPKTIRQVSFDSKGTIYILAEEVPGYLTLSYSPTQGRSTLELIPLDLEIPLRKMTPAPGGAGVVLLTEDGFLLHAQARPHVQEGGTSELRLQLRQLNTELNLVQDLVFGPVTSDQQRAVIALTAADPEKSKPTQLKLLWSEGQAAPSSLKEAVNITHSLPLKGSAVGLFSNTEELSTRKLQNLVRQTEEPRILRPKVMLDLENQFHESRPGRCERTLMNFFKANPGLYRN